MAVPDGGRQARLLVMSHTSGPQKTGFTALVGQASRGKHIGRACGEPIHTHFVKRAGPHALFPISHDAPVGEAKPGPALMGMQIKPGWHAPDRVPRMA
jgi:hypothetical protein